MGVLSQKSEGGDLASATPSHFHSDWPTPKACSLDELVETLAQHGAHTTDMGDALYAGQDWLSGKPT